ncbi:MAG: hypothetical protein ACP5R5_01610 [Armatimonadota bacterium]
MTTTLATVLLFACCVSALASSPAQPNLISNGGFEEGDGGPDGRQKGVGRDWETVCGGPHPEIYALDSKVKHSGKFSQRMGSRGFNYRWIKAGGYCYHIDGGREVQHPCPTELGLQAIAQTTRPGAVRPGKIYSCSVWVKMDGLTEKWEWFRLSVYWLDAKGQFIGEAREPESNRNNVGTHDWKPISLTAAAPPDAAFAKIYLQHHFTHGTVWYDDVCLHEVQAVSDRATARY